MFKKNIFWGRTAKKNVRQITFEILMNISLPVPYKIHYKKGAVRTKYKIEIWRGFFSYNLMFLYIYITVGVSIF